MKIAVIFGGMSTEHNVSISSGTSAIKNLNKQKYDIYPIYIDKSGNWYKYTKEITKIDTLKIGEELKPLEKIENVIEYLKNIDVIFPVLHGLYGEDGTIQGLFELIKKPYVGCRVLASSLAMDKVYAKMIFEKAKLNQTKYIYIRKCDEDNYIYIDDNFEHKKAKLELLSDFICSKLNFPLFIKPSNSGSSVGVKKANSINELKENIKYAGKYDKKILIEEGVNGRELECSVLGNENIIASCVGEIMPDDEFYSYEAKYENKNSKVVIPAKLDKKIQEKIKEIAIKAFKAIDGSGLARVDFFLNNNNDILINEINTMPGFTEISMYAKLWKEDGISFEKLLDKLIDLALE